ncbi:LacI family DNA-binding transcriptional regulator [Actinotalea sp. Marseille-Q4924]|uniref:LacI family DNA-binding transcriptional regulator n=1 Tax=Actinotalea sp. Marseille-Q4924 TaxID=2866571 RepID=UPI001CE3D40C|nr:LacI family DNA-binding transcriptional regulator [Actinotalea sp. Marseille-Q4924]
MGATERAEPRLRPARLVGATSRPTVKDVAALAGVSRSAASRALSGTGYVGQESRRRVLEAAAELGYVPHMSARYLKDRVSRCVGVLTLDVRRPEDAAVVAGVCAAARESGLATMVADLAGRPLDALEALRDFVAFGVAGSVLCPVSVEPVAYLSGYAVPVVEVGRQFAPGRCDAVVAGGERRATGLLVDPDEAVAMGREAVALLLRRFEEPARPVEVVGMGAGA